MWIIDSSATLHVISRKEFFTSYTIGDFGVLKMGNDGVSKVISVGDFGVLKMGNDGVKHARDVCFNMISVHMLDDGGYDNHFGYGKLKLTKVNLVVARGKKISKLYLTKALIANNSVNAMDMEASLWHQRLSHINEKGLNCLAKNDMLLRLKNAELEKCSHYMASKQTRVSFKKHPPSRKLELLELVHSDVCGPLKDVLVLYFEVKGPSALVERQSGKKVKCIRSDNGGEYYETFDVYCKQQGIKHEKTSPKTPQLNGLVERMNRTLIERVRCMLSKARLSKHFWGKIVYTVVHVISLNLVVALNTKVPYNIWFGIDVKYDLRVFGCKTFVHVPNDERSKLDMKTRIYDLVERKLVRSRDVQFMEGQTIEDIDEVKKSTLEKNNIEKNLNITRSPWRVKKGKRLSNLNCGKLAKVHIDTDDNGTNMMTKAVPRGKFEACCKIAGLAITST
ncbi:hypothetical protein CR513_31358, partial [Mucuna pruriens]